MSCSLIHSPPYIKEKGWLASPAKFIAAAVVAAMLGKFIFTAYLPFALGVTAWSFFSCAVILLNRHAEGTRFEKIVHKMHALTMEVNAIPIKIVLFPFTFFRQTFSPSGPLTGRPILMINGYLSFASTWTFHKNNLARKGLGPIYTMNVGSGRSIDTYAQQIGEKVKEIQKETGRKDLILIGHSKGGLVSSHFATKYAGAIGAHVTDVVTIGSPLAGTPAARFGLGLDALEMGPKSPFHQDLRSRINGNLKTRFYHIGSDADKVVSRISALFGKNWERQMVLKDTGHIALLFSSRVSDQMCKWIETGLV